MGGRPCLEKIILNTGVIALTADQLQAEVEYLRDKGETINDDDGYKIVELLNKAENLMFDAQKTYLESTGFVGPFPRSMGGKAY